MASDKMNTYLGMLEIAISGIKAESNGDPVANAHMASIELLINAMKGQTTTTTPTRKGRRPWTEEQKAAASLRAKERGLGKKAAPTAEAIQVQPAPNPVVSQRSQILPSGRPRS
jgi:hypothetical protein